MFKGKRFKQQSHLNASTTENELPMVSSHDPYSTSLRKRSIIQQANRSLCAKKHPTQGRNNQYSLQHKNNPEEMSIVKKNHECSNVQEGKKQVVLSLKRKETSTHIFSLKIKEKSSSTVTPIMRIIVIDWLMQVAIDLEITKEALHTSIHYLDQLLLKLTITKKQLQVYGLCCLMIAQKLESQRNLTPAQASQLLNNEIADKDFITLEEHIIKTLEFKLQPVTLWTEMCILLRAFESYFKDKINELWRIFRNRVLWIIEGVCMQNNYFGRTIMQRQLCIALLFSSISQYNPCLVRYFSSFAKSIFGFSVDIEQMQRQFRYLKTWQDRSCNCISRYSSDDYHPQLKIMAASCICN